MAQTLRLKRSSVPGRVPTTATLQTGEIAINTADGLVYIRKDDDTIIPLLGANTVVTGSITLLGSVEATSFTGSFSGSADGLRGVVLDYSASAGDGMLAFTYNGSADAIISLDTGSGHFVNAVVGLIDSNAPSIIAQDTTGAGGIDLSYNSDTGALSGSLVYSEITIGDNAIALGQSVSSLSSVAITGSFSGEASGSFRGDGSQLTGISASVLDNALTLGAGLAGGSFNGSSPVTASIEVTSTHFREGVRSHISASSTTGPGGINLSYEEATGTVSGSLVYNDIQLGYTSIQLGGSAASVTGLNLENTKSTGSFSGSFTGLIDNAVSASYASFASNAESSSYANFASTSTSASYSETSTSASYANTSTSASHALIADYALNVNVNTGSLVETGSISDATITLTKVDGSSFDLVVDNVASASVATSASHALIADYALNANIDTGSLLETGSISNATITLTKADGSSFNLVVDNVASASYAGFAETASYATTAVTASHAVRALSSSYADFTAFAENAISASYAATASSANDFLVRGDATVNGDLTVDGIVTAREFHTQFISASITYDSGSNKFGDSADDIHQFTGSVVVSGSIDSDDITINDWGSVSASLALLNASSSATTLQQVTDNGNTTTNEVIINNQLQVSESIYSRGEEVLDFAVAMAIALG